MLHTEGTPDTERAAACRPERRAHRVRSRGGRGDAAHREGRRSPSVVEALEAAPAVQSVVRLLDADSRVVACRTVRVTQTITVKLTRRQWQHGLPGSYFRLASGDFAVKVDRADKVLEPGHRFTVRQVRCLTPSAPSQ